MYDYYLGGKENFAADREAAEKALAVAPELRLGATEVRRFLQRVVRYLTARGIRQFIDIGCGLPTLGNTHEIAQVDAPDARVVYVDNDPVVIAHARALLENNPLTTVLGADAREPEALLADPALNRLVDLEQPVAVLLIALLHVIPDDELAASVVRRLRDAICPGSYLAIAHAVSDLRPAATAQLASLYQEKVVISGLPPRPNLRSRAEVAPYFTGLELVEPGLVYLPEWRPDPGAPPPAVPVWSVGGVARKPAPPD